MDISLQQLRDLDCFGLGCRHPRPDRFSLSDFHKRFEMGEMPAHTCRDKLSGFQWVASAWWNGKSNKTTWTPSLDDPGTRGCLEGMLLGFRGMLRDDHRWQVLARRHPGETDRVEGEGQTRGVALAAALVSQATAAA